METELILTLKIHIAYRMTDPEIGTTDEAGRSEIIPGGAEILAIQAETPNGEKYINITDLVPAEDIERLTDLCSEDGKRGGW